MEADRISQPDRRIQGALLLVALAAAVFWFAQGWQIGFPAPIPPILPAWPVEGIRALVITLVWIVVMTAPVYLVLRRVVGRHLDRPGLWALSFCLGFSLNSALVSWLAFFIYPLVPVFSLFLLAFNDRKGGHRDLFRTYRFAPGFLLLALACIVVVIAAAGPAVESDGLRYHLVGPSEWRRAGAFVLIPFSANSNLPSALGLIAGSIAGGEALGRVYQLLNAAHFAALAVLTGSLSVAVARGLAATGRYRIGTHEGAIRWGCSALIATTPVVAIVGAWPFADVAAAGLLIAALLAAEPGILRHGWVRPLAVGLLLGACVATKLSMLPLAVPAALWTMFRMRPGSWGALALFVAAGLFVFLAWPLKSAIYHGNPVYPVAYGIFGGPEWSVENDLFYKQKAAEKGNGTGIVPFMLLPLELIRNWRAFESHNPGFWFIPAAIATAAGFLTGMRRRRGSTIFVGLSLLFAVGVISWFFSYQSVRFLIPHFAILAALAAPLLVRWGNRWIPVALALPGLVWILVYTTALSPALQAGTGLVSSRFILEARFNSYGAIEWLNERCEPGEPVIYIGEHRAAYAFTYRPICSDWFDTPRILTEIRSSPDNTSMLARWKSEGVRYVLINQAELSGYEARYFQPRFSEAEWIRFQELRRSIAAAVIFESQPGILVCQLPESPIP